MITDTELERLERLAEAATAGPWYPGHLSRDDHPCDCPYILCDGYMGSIADVCFDDEKLVSNGGNDSPPIVQAKANQVFIATSREAIPSLISSVRELRARAEAAEAENKRLRSFRDFAWRYIDDKNLADADFRSLVANHPVLALEKHNG